MEASHRTGIKGQLTATLRVTLISLLGCGVFYPGLVWVLIRTVAPGSAEGWLLDNGRGESLGSEIVAQPFSNAKYFWPRPSAIGYNGAASGGSNMASTSERLRLSAIRELARLQDGSNRPVPQDLVTASGSGLDPHITLAAAEFQLPRVARARGVDEAWIRKRLERRAFSAGGFLAPERIVNVLLLNLDLDKRAESGRGRATAGE